MKKLKMIDLCCGIGGFHLGLKDYVDVIMAFDIDPAARSIYYYNFGIEPKSDFTVRKNLPKCDIITGGFPCQPFSTAGYRHGVDDARGNIFFDIVRLANTADAEILILENVPGLMAIDNGKTFRTFLRHLRNNGYTIYYKIMDANAVVPQNRRRVFFICLRGKYKDKQFWFPNPPRTKKTIKDILEPIDDFFSEAKVKELEMFFNPYVHYKFEPQFIGPYERAPTLRAQANEFLYKDGRKIRRFTNRELARIMGFPDDFVFPVSKSIIKFRLGNAVVPSLVKLIADEMNRQIFKLDKNEKILKN